MTITCLTSRRYCILTTLQTLYAFFVEGNVVFVGKRKSFSKRVRSIGVVRRRAVCANPPPLQIITEKITLSSRTERATRETPPAYELSITYLRSTSGGKSLLAKGKTRGAAGYNTFFDASGVMDQEKFERWVGELVEEAMEGKTS